MEPIILIILLCLTGGGLLIGWKVNGPVGFVLFLLGAGLLLTTGVILKFDGISKIGSVTSTESGSTTTTDYGYIDVTANEDFGIDALSWLFIVCGVVLLGGVTWLLIK